MSAATKRIKASDTSAVLSMLDAIAKAVDVDRGFIVDLLQRHKDAFASEIKTIRDREKTPTTAQLAERLDRAERRYGVESRPPYAPRALSEHPADVQRAVRAVKNITNFATGQKFTEAEALERVLATR